MQVTSLNLLADRGNNSATWPLSVDCGLRLHGLNREQLLPFSTWLVGLTDLLCLISLQSVQGKAFFVRINGNCLNSQLVAGAKHPDGDLTSSGNHQLAKWDHWTTLARVPTRELAQGCSVDGKARDIRSTLRLDGIFQRSDG